jgi:hypothetical protein
LSKNITVKSCSAVGATETALLLNYVPKDRLALNHPRSSMPNKMGSLHRFWLAHAAPVAMLALFALIRPFTSADAASPITLKVEAVHGLPGLHHSELSRFLAAHMADAGFADWRFEPAEGDTAAPNRVEWTFRLNPYAGGEVRNFVHTLVYEQKVGVHRPITIEARLYLNGEYQTLVERQAMMQGGPNDPELSAAVASATAALLGPSGAYHAIDLGQRTAPGAR